LCSVDTVFDDSFNKIRDGSTFELSTQHYVP
jgi:hypothetical protein